jgi:hypothetical protein
MSFKSLRAAASAVLFCSVFSIRVFAGDDPFADHVISYVEGRNASPAYLDPAVVLGSPERFTGEGIFPVVVSAFSPPFGVDEILSIGGGGEVIVRFDTPITDDPNNLYGIDLIIFGNAGFIDVAYPDGVCDGSVFGDDGGAVDVSADGINWFAVTGRADSIFPTIGYADSGPFDESAGSADTDFARPVDPSLTLGHFTGLNNAQIVATYRGSGGGSGFDIASSGLSSVSFVRIRNPINAKDAIEIDAVSDVSPRLPGDVDLDGVVNIDDLVELITAWGATTPGGPPADFDGNHLIDIDDLVTLITHWTN